MKNKTKILFTGGGTGGHIIPIIAIAREIKKLDPNNNLRLIYTGPKDEFGRILLSQENIEIKEITSGKIRRYTNIKSIFQNIIDIFIKIPIGFFKAFFYLFFTWPDLIVSKGGFGSIPTVLAGWLLRVPIFLHESDVMPGLANRLLGNFATQILVSFTAIPPYFPKNRISVIGNPIRQALLHGQKEDAVRFFKLTQEKPIILILGGSQGSQRINDTILTILPKLIKEFEIIHQCGDNNFTQTRAEARVMINKEMEKYYHIFGFLKEEELKKAYAVADIIISRAGSGTIFEIAAIEKPAILVPLAESAQDHQLKNAYAYSETGAAIVLEETNFTPHFFLEKLRFLISNQSELEKMKNAAKNFAKPLASREIATQIVNYLKPKTK